MILISTKDWESIQETMYLSSIKGFKESLIEADSDVKEDWISEEDLKW